MFDSATDLRVKSGGVLENFIGNHGFPSFKRCCRIICMNIDFQVAPTEIVITDRVARAQCLGELVIEASQGSAILA